jgi:LuxR family maltose regulon positive regulatory protein
MALVLDDLQTVTDRECLASIDFALRHLPASARMLAITRADPGLGLARLRARGALVELRADELAFTTAEAHELLVERGQVALRAEELELLVENTEGWPAALVLAGLWLRGVDDPGQAVSAFGGDQRFVVEYLSQEVLAALDDDDRSFLQGAAVLGRFTAELCDAVLERTDSASVLARLERSNLFIRRLERGGWFRAHSLFAEFAVAQLSAQEPGEAARIHQRAAEWLLSQGLPVEAVEHAAAARDDELVARLLAEHHMSLIRSGLTRTLLRWVRPLPDENVLEHPELAVAAAAAAVMAGQGTIEHRRYLRIVERAQAERPERVTPYVEAFALVERAITIDGGVAQAVEDGRRAVELARAGLDELLTGALAGYALALYFADSLDEAWEVALSVIEHPSIERRPPSHALARTTLALVAVERGWLESARGHAEKAKAVVGRIGTSRSWLGANASAALGAVLASEGKLAEAEHEIAYAERYFRDEIATVHHAWLLVLLAGAQTQRGRLDRADASLQAARKALEELADGGRLASMVDDVEHELRTATAQAGSGEMLDRPSKAEFTVLQLLAGDLSTREIGEHLFVSPNTIRSHTRALYRKLGANSRPDAVARATALGLLARTDAARSRSPE